jgi:hypothetical protein
MTTEEIYKIITKWEKAIFFKEDEFNENIDKILKQIRLFLIFIDENTDNILQKLSLNIDNASYNKDLQAFFCCLEEDTEEIRKALNIIRDYIDKIDQARIY